MNEPLTSREKPQGFPQTRWSVVLAARQDTSSQSLAALETICRSYWYPLYAHARRRGHSPHDAQDVTQGFFCQLLEKRWLDSADREKGRLRTFLMVALKKYMAKEWRRACAEKRGGGEIHIPLDTASAESRYASDAGAELQPDDLFDQQWALMLIDLTIQRLRAEFEAAHKVEDFEALKICLMAEHGRLDYSAMATRLRSSEGTARVAVHRLRKRFREVYREEISQTLADEEDLDTELRHLVAALAKR